MEKQARKSSNTFTEEIEVMGSQLVQQVKDLLKEGNVRQLRLKASDGDIMLETPLSFGVVAGGAVVLAAPWLAILGAIAAFVTHARLEIVRDIEPAGTNETAAKVTSPASKSTRKSAPKVATKPKIPAKVTVKTKARSKTQTTGASKPGIKTSGA